MSSAFWRIKRQTEQFSPGITLTQNVLHYIKTWEDRCYENGIPDEIPPSLMKSLRVPSYKAIAVAILKNDMNLNSVGFSMRESQLVNDLIYKTPELTEQQLNLEF